MLVLRKGVHRGLAVAPKQQPNLIEAEKTIAMQTRRRRRAVKMAAATAVAVLVTNQGRLYFVQGLELDFDDLWFYSKVFELYCMIWNRQEIEAGGEVERRILKLSFFYRSNLQVCVYRSDKSWFCSQLCITYIMFLKFKFL